MVRKKVDNRIRILIENGIRLGHRSIFMIVGPKCRDQVVILHHMLSKSVVKARPSVLWCYRKELGFNLHRRKRVRKIEKRVKQGLVNVDENDPFELFVASTQIRYCFYKDSHKILGNTYGMCVLQDFEALTPNLLARTVETVEGGGIVVFLLDSVSSLRQLYTIQMDVHSRYRTEALQDIVPRFNERFILSLISCKQALVIDDALNVLELSAHMVNMTSNAADLPHSSASCTVNPQVQALVAQMDEGEPVAKLLARCRTLDQAHVLLRFTDVLSDKNFRATVAVTAARGRGKSAALGLSLAAALALGYSNIYVTAPSAHNLRTLFQFVLCGFDALDYHEHHEYEIIQSTSADLNKAIVRVNVFKHHRQTIQYIDPTESAMLNQAELLVIDEAAAIPLTLVQNLIGPYLLFLSSTVNGYEGTGRSLSLKLIQKLRAEQSSAGIPSAHTRILHELTLSESIRYKPGDDVETWLSRLLCLDICDHSNDTASSACKCPLPQDCDLYYVNRDTLFSYHRASEMFLQRLMSIFVASHYKNSPNDLQMLSDAPGHHVYCLLAPLSKEDDEKSILPEVLCAIQICLEGGISRSTISDGLSQGKKAFGDLIPWNIAQQFQDKNFPLLFGARIVRIAVHPDYIGMRYGSYALELLHKYYEYEFPVLSQPSTVLNDTDSCIDDLSNSDKAYLLPRTKLPPLLHRLDERVPEKLHYIGVAYGLTRQLYRFWKRAGYVPVYIRQTPNDLIGEHTCIMLRTLAPQDSCRESPAEFISPHLESSSWLTHFFTDFRRRFVALLGFQFSRFDSVLALEILQSGFNLNIVRPDIVSRHNLELFINPYDLQRMQLYTSNLADFHLIMDLLPSLARLYCLQLLPSDLKLSAVQATILVGMGFQHKSVENLTSELGLLKTQLLGLFNRSMNKITSVIKQIFEDDIEKSIIEIQPKQMNPALKTIDEELNEAAQELADKQKKIFQTLRSEVSDEYLIKGSENEWKQTLSDGIDTSEVVTIKGGKRQHKNKYIVKRKSSSIKTNKFKKHKPSISNK